MAPLIIQVFPVENGFVTPFSLQGLTKDEINERRIMKLMLKIKNGTPPMRKVSLRQITDNARSFGAGPLFNQILPLLMSPTLEDQERHLLVKVVDRVLCVHPFMMTYPTFPRFCRRFFRLV